MNKLCGLMIIKSTEQINKQSTLTIEIKIQKDIKNVKEMIQKILSNKFKCRYATNKQ